MLSPLAQSTVFVRARVALATAILLVGIQAGAQTTTSVPDPEALVQHAVSLRLAEEASHHHFRFVFRKKDGGHVFTREIVETSLGDVARLVAVNDSPLGPAARKEEADRLQTLADNPALQQHRFRREQADQARADKLLRQLPVAFKYRYVGSAPCQVEAVPQIVIPGVPPTPASAMPEPDTCYHLTFRPNPHWSPPDLESRILTAMAGDVWIDSAGDRLHRLNAHVVSDVAFGWGIVGRLNRGGTVFLEQDRLSGNDWQLTRMKLNLTGKLLLVKTLRIRIDETIGNFQPVPADLDYREAVKMLLSSPPPPSQ